MLVVVLAANAVTRLRCIDGLVTKARCGFQANLAGRANLRHGLGSRISRRVDSLTETRLNDIVRLIDEGD